MKRLVTKVFDRWTGLFMQETRRSTKKGGRVESCCGLGARERCRHALVCRELDTELLAQEKSGKRKEEAHSLFFFVCVCVCVWIAILVFLSLSRFCGIDRRSFVEMFCNQRRLMTVRREMGFRRRRQRVLCGKMNFVVFAASFRR